MNTTLSVTKESFFSYLKEQTLAVIATTSSDAQPEAATVDYFMDDNWNIYVLTHKETRKVENIQKNNKVAVVVGTVLATHTAQIEGKARIIKPSDPEFSDLLLHFAGLKSLYASPLFKITGVDLVIIKITITWLRWLEINKESMREIYTVIIPDR